FQWRHTKPYGFSCAGDPCRRWAGDMRDRKRWCPYGEWPGELVTHESWWVNDQLLFCGAEHGKPMEQSHVKVLDLHTGVVRIVGAGGYGPGAAAEGVTKRNWAQ